MKAMLRWQEGMAFTAQTTDGKSTPMDAKSPIGKGTAPTPKELVLMGLGGCTAMDVIALLKKYKQLPNSFEINVDAETSQNQHPAVFTSGVIEYVVTGEVEAEKLLEAVKLSQTKYCGVSAMLAKAFPIEYKVILNDTIVGTGNTHFE